MKGWLASHCHHHRHIISLVFEIITLAGGIYAIKRRRWGLVLAGPILAMLSRSFGYKRKKTDIPMFVQW